MVLVRVTTNTRQSLVQPIQSHVPSKDGMEPLFVVDLEGPQNT